jgi:putative glutamine amidotransferase
MIKPVIGLTAASMSGDPLRSAVNVSYVRAISAAGGVPLSIPGGLDDACLDQIVSLMDGILLTGGVDVAPENYGERPAPNLGPIDPVRDRLELGITRRALETELPILGICRGIQVLAVAEGGSLYQDLPSQLGEDVRHEVRELGRQHCCHLVEVLPGTHLAAALGTTRMKVNSLHHQAVKDVPPGLVVSARSPDGVTEGLEVPHHPFAVGVQCHPEEIWDSTGPQFAGLFSAFLEAARRPKLSIAV